MKKNELVHYHALLREISTDFADRGIVTRDDFDEYRRLDVSPVALRASRDDHEEAVLLLAEVLSRAAERSTDEATPGTESSADERPVPSW
ncbi:UPF0058 family protein [Halopelagius longus]|uniref:Metal-binding protein n=1 Tax=Halopelagius longus TaxID=1236180 RepID=A0A1H1B195_9EURY|nr:UPF0058 family protein [Halopelagius longus]RDI70599.1 hypothetical protein DWB78_02035 [Halopelagius longus]SDQ45662.1 hypothetical protein SAMN05216278_1587 [Halopelagius longus]